MTLTAGMTALKEVVADYFDLSDPLPLNERVLLLRCAADLIADLNLVRESLSESIAADMEGDTFTVSGVGTVVRSRGGTRKNWKGEEVRSRIVERFSAGVDPETGEVLTDPKTIASRVAEDFAQCAGTDRPSHGWRAGELKKREIALHDVCEYQEGRTSVRFV